EVADQRGFARTGQAHDHIDAAMLDGQADVAQAQRVAAFGQQLVLAHALTGALQPALRMGAEDLVDIADFNLAHAASRVWKRRPNSWVIRSNRMASSTMPRPAISPRPTCRRLMPCNTSQPNPRAPLMEAITTMARANLVAWLM